MEAPFDIDEGVVPPQYRLERVVVLGGAFFARAEETPLLGDDTYMMSARFLHCGPPPPILVCIWY